MGNFGFSGKFWILGEILDFRGNCTVAWVTRPERPKGVKDVIKQAQRAQSRPEEPQPRSQGPEGPQTSSNIYFSPWVTIIICHCVAAFAKTNDQSWHSVQLINPNRSKWEKVKWKCKGKGKWNENGIEMERRSWQKVKLDGGDLL